MSETIATFVFFIIIVLLPLLSFLIYLKYKKALKELEKTKKILEESKKVQGIQVKARTRQLKEQAETLGEENIEKTRALRERLKELEKFHRLTVGRELKMITLKKEVKKMEAQLREANLEFKKNAKSSNKKRNR